MHQGLLAEVMQCSCADGPGSRPQGAPAMGGEHYPVNGQVFGHEDLG